MSNTKKKIEELKEKIAELEAELNNPKAMFERAEVGTEYHIIGSGFMVQSENEVLHSVDKGHYSVANYYLDNQLAIKVAKYYRDNNWYIRKAIEFADGYKFNSKGNNFCIEIDTDERCYYIDSDSGYERLSTIYMSDTSANAFKAWLEEFAPLKYTDS